MLPLIRWIIVLLLMVGFWAEAASAQTMLSRTHYLLLDGRVVDQVENAVLRVGRATRDKANPLFVQDRPWEPTFGSVYPNIWFDSTDKTYKCWYSPFVLDPGSAKISKNKRGTVKYPGGSDRTTGLCLATSKDGLTWQKPSLKVHLWDGKPSNIVRYGPAGSGVLLDRRATDQNQRLKTIFRAKQMATAFSPDGIAWSEPKSLGIEVAADAHHNLFWAPSESRYVVITTRAGKSNPVLVRLESRDFKKWSKPLSIFRDKDDVQPIAMSVVFRRGVYLGLISLHDTKTDRVSVELAWSADTKKWHRIEAGSPLISMTQKKGDYDWGGLYPAQPIFESDHVRLYYGGSDGPHRGWRAGCLAMARLRLDGFAGYAAKDAAKPASVLTQPMQYDGRPWRLTADAVGGSVRMVLFDATGRVELMRSEPVASDVTAAVVKWPAGSDPKDLQGVAVRVKFEIHQAKVYAFGFRR